MALHLLSTNNYGLFCYKDVNRPIETERHKRLYASMKAHGFIKSFPITVKRKGGKLEILDGQHRHAIAMQLKLHVYYIEVESDIDIPEINSTQVPWTVQTYIDSYAKAGKQDYLLVKEFKTKYQLPIGECAALLAGTISYHNVMPQIKNGTYKVKDAPHAYRVGSVLSQISQVYKKANTKPFIDAICSICRLKDVELSRLVENIRKHPHMMQPYGTRDTVLTMLETVYNFGRRTLYPLAINAQNEMKRRNACGNEKIKNESKTH